MMRTNYLLILFILVVILAFSGCSPQSDTTDGDLVDGDQPATDGDIPDRDTADGDEIDGDATDGDNPVDGDTTDGDQESNESDGDLADGDKEPDVPDGDLDPEGEDEDELEKADGDLPVDGDAADGDPIDGDGADGDYPDGDLVDGDTPGDGDEEEENPGDGDIDPEYEEWAETGFFFLSLENGSILNASLDTGAAVGFQGDIAMATDRVVSARPMLLCRFNSLRDRSARETLCTHPEYDAVAEGIIDGNVGAFADVELSEGQHVLSAELVLPGDRRVATAPITVTIDTLKPEISPVDGWLLHNDDGGGGDPRSAGDGILNLAEAPTREAEITVTFVGLGGDRPVRIYTSGDQLVSEGVTAGDIYSFVASLAEGGHELRAETADIHNNPLQPGAPTLGLSVDSVPPTLSWIVPYDGAALLADQDLDTDPENDLQILVRLASDAPLGQPVVLSADGTDLPGSPLAVGQAGLVEGELTIVQGDAVSLEAGVTDEAFNVTTRGIAVLVDVQAPTIAIASLADPADTDPDSVGIQLTLEVMTTYAETGRQIRIESDLSMTVVGTGQINGGAQPPDIVSTLVYITIPGGTHNLTASVEDINGNGAVSEPLTLVLAHQGCGLVFTDPVGDSVAIDASGYSGDGSIDPKTVTVSLALQDPECDGQEVVVRIGCGLDDEDGDCNRIVSGAVSGTAVSIDVDFYDGEETTIHARIVHPTNGVVDYTDQKTVVVDLVAPEVSLVSPSAQMELDQQLAAQGGEWSLDGSEIVGFVVFDVAGAAGGSYSIRYQHFDEGASLADGTGPIDERTIDGDGQLNHQGVRFISVDEEAHSSVCPGYPQAHPGVCLEVRVQDRVGNTSSAAVPINVDVLSPSQPVFDTVNPDPMVPRSGRTEIGWTACTDDTAGGGAVVRYEIRITEDPAPEGWLDLPAQDIETWEDQILLAELAASPEPDYVIEALGFDALWHVGIRAIDEVGNRSQGSELNPPVNTMLSRQLIGDASGCRSDNDGLHHLGDVNGDGRDDILLACEAAVTLFLGEADPSAFDISGNPLSLSSPHGLTTFGNTSASLGDINGDEIPDFMVGDILYFSPAGNGAMYIYFGVDPAEFADRSAMLVELTTPDLNILGPPGATIVSDWRYGRSGSGNIYDLGETPGAIDDYLMITWDYVTDRTTVLILLGRSDADWLAATEPYGDLAGDWLLLSTDPAANCMIDVLTIDGVDPPGRNRNLSTSQLGFNTGIGLLDDDGWADLVLSTAHEGGAPVVPSNQFVYYGGALIACPDTGWTLSDFDELILNGGESASLYAPRIALPHPVDPPAQAGEYAVGLWRDDALELYAWSNDTSSTGLYDIIDYPSGGLAGLPGPSAIRFGSSLAYAGNLDQDVNDRTDLVIGSIAATGYSQGYLMAVLWENDEWSLVPLDVTGGEQLGHLVQGGMDFNGDGLADIAVVESEGDVTLLY